MITDLLKALREATTAWRRTQNAAASEGEITHADFQRRGRRPLQLHDEPIQVVWRVCYQYWIDNHYPPTLMEAADLADLTIGQVRRCLDVLQEAKIIERRKSVSRGIKFLRRPPELRPDGTEIDID